MLYFVRLFDTYIALLLVIGPTVSLSQLTQLRELMAISSSGISKSSSSGSSTVGYPKTELKFLFGLLMGVPVAFYQLLS